MAAVHAAAPSSGLHTADTLGARYHSIRQTSLRICEPLELEDYVVQSMPDASPAKWHLAHTSWFFEQFLLKPSLRGYRPFNPRFEYLFNSYYQSVGPMHDRPHRGLLTRPTVAEVRRYREHVDEHMQRLIDARGAEATLAALVTLGLNHEQQHQELMHTDLKHLFACNPLLPAYRAQSAAPASAASPLQFQRHEGGLVEIGATGEGFHFDNEGPRHRVFIKPFELAERLITNSEYLEFIRDGGYRRAELWLADGWGCVQGENWNRPVYWSESLDSEFTLCGVQPLDPAAPASHLSYYEADAFARWTGWRLPLEAEWEHAASWLKVAGNLLERGALHPLRAADEPGVKQMFGDLWEWTASPYAAYPGFRAPGGALGEYNGKFMCNQLVLRGGSCVTPADHIRASYRNFFYPQARWQFMGVRLARDL